MFLKIAPIAAAALFSISAFAVEKEFTVTAQIDPTIELLRPDGTALNPNLTMGHSPVTGLSAVNFDAKVFTNDATKAVEFRLSGAPQLLNQTVPSADAIPLAVRVDGKAVTVEGIKMNPNELFHGDDKGSKVLPISIAQATPAPITSAGVYTGAVRLVVTQAAGTL